MEITNLRNKLIRWLAERYLPPVWVKFEVREDARILVDGEPLCGSRVRCLFFDELPRGIKSLNKLFK